MELSFIIIDDSELDCFIARKIIEHTDRSIPIESFQDAQLVLKKIRYNHPVNAATPNKKTVILLDVQMPLMNGFEFVEEYEKLDDDVKKHYLVVILSSTRNSNDIFRILTYPSVHSILEKPFTREKLLDLMMSMRSNS